MPTPKKPDFVRLVNCACDLMHTCTVLLNQHIAMNQDREKYLDATSRIMQSLLKEEPKPEESAAEPSGGFADLTKIFGKKE